MQHGPTRTLSAWKNVGFVVMLYALAMISAYSSGVYFLFAYYSIQPGETHYNGPVQVTWADGDYLLSLKTVAQQSTLLSDLKIVMGLRAVLLSNFTGGRACPPGFAYRNHHHAGRDEPCEYAQLHEFNFLGFALEYDTLAPGYQGLTERPEDVELLSFRIANGPSETDAWNRSTAFVVELLQFASKHGSCRTVDDCQDFAAEVARNREGLPYVPGSVQCVSPSAAAAINSSLSGCAVGLRLGTSPDCFPDDSFIMECDFALFFNFFVRPAEIFLVADLWKWGTILFVISLFLWGVVSMLHARRLHLQYLRYYYLPPTHLYLEEGETYELKMTLAGQRFTKRNGTFRVLDASSALREPLFQLPLRIAFGEEYVEGEQIARHQLRAAFRHDSPGGGGGCYAAFEIDWADDFTSAYVTVPHLQLEIRRAIPARVKTPWNLVFAFPFFLFGLICRRPPPSRLLRYGHYVWVVAYITSVQLAWLVFVVFATMSFSSHTSFLRSLVWGSMETRPWGSLALFLAFQFFIFTSLVAHFVCLSLLSKLRPKPRVTEGAGPQSPLLSSSIITINALHEDANMYRSAEGEEDGGAEAMAMDFSTIDFVPLTTRSYY